MSQYNPHISKTALVLYYTTCAIDRRCHGDAYIIGNYVVSATRKLTAESTVPTPTFALW